MGTSNNEKLKRKAPQIIVIVLAVALTAYILFQIIEDVVVEGAPWSSLPLIGAIAGFLGNVTSTVSSWGYLGIFGLMLLEASSLPIPSEVVLPFSGYLVSTGTLDFGLILIVATIAAMAGSLIDYAIGLKGVEALTKYRILGRAIFSESQLKVAAGWFARHGAIMVFLGRLVPGFRTIISFPAGAVRMSLPKFLLYTFAGCVIWNILLIYVGYYLGINWKAVADVAHYIIIVTVVVLVLATAAYLIVRRNRRKKAQQSQFVKYVM